MQVAFFLVKAIKAPTLEVTTVLVRVWSPLSSVDSALVSPRIGSKILSSGFASMLVK